jgi:hypothetical protein
MGLRPTRSEKRLGPATTLYETVALSFVIPKLSRISYFTAFTAATYVVLSKENHMQSIEAATRDRKFGEAEGSAVPQTLLERPNVILKQNCHLDRSVAEWRDLRSLLPGSHAISIRGPGVETNT